MPIEAIVLFCCTLCSQRLPGRVLLHSSYKGFSQSGRMNADPVCLKIFMPCHRWKWCRRHTASRSVRLWVREWVCASQKSCGHHISKTNAGNFTQFW